MTYVINKIYVLIALFLVFATNAVGEVNNDYVGVSNKLLEAHFKSATVKFEEQAPDIRLLAAILELSSDSTSDEMLWTQRWSNDPGIETLQLFKELYHSDLTENEKESSLRRVKECADSKAGLIGLRCSIIASVYSSDQRNTIGAIKYADKALIKTEKLDDGLESDIYRFFAYDVAQVALALDLNNEGLVRSLEQMIELSDKRGLQLDGVTLAFNLAMNRYLDKDLKTAEKILGRVRDVLPPEDLDQEGPVVNGLSLVFMEQGKTLDTIRLIDEYDVWSFGEVLGAVILGRKALAHALRGENEGARAAIKELENNNDVPFELLEVLNKGSLLQAEYLIDASEGRLGEAYVKQKSWYEYKLDRELENSRAERVKASMELRETEAVQDIKLEQARLEAEVLRKSKDWARLLVIFLCSIIAALLAGASFLVRSRRKLRNVNLILERKTFEAEAAVRTKERFISLMGHEFKTPLNAIIPLSAQLMKSLKNKNNRELLSHVQAGGKRLDEMIDNMLILSTDLDQMPGQRDEKVTVLIEDLVKNAITEFKSDLSRKSLSIRLIKHKAFMPVQVINRKIVEKIINNVLSNAVKFTHEGGIEIVLNRSSKLQGWSIEIKDTGIGMEKETIERAFQLFEQEEEGISRSFEGAGIGLSVCDRLIKEINGEIVIRSEKNRGTTVELHFPYGIGIKDRGAVPFSNIVSEAA